MLVRRWGRGGTRGRDISTGRGLVKARGIGRSWFGGERRLLGKSVCFYSSLICWVSFAFSLGKGLC